jgi:hypothetical protein
MNFQIEKRIKFIDEQIEGHQDAIKKCHKRKREILKETTIVAKNGELDKLISVSNKKYAKKDDKYYKCESVGNYQYICVEITKKVFLEAVT